MSLGVKFFEKMAILAGQEAGKSFASLIYTLNMTFNETQTWDKDQDLVMGVLCPYKARADQV